MYDAFFRPYVAKHENYIDRNLSELKTRAGDIIVLTWQRAMSYGQTRVVEILQYIASQSAPPTGQAQVQISTVACYFLTACLSFPSLCQWDHKTV